MSDFFDVARRQRACREFAPEPVPDETIELILRTATYAPSAENSQPWEFIVVKDPSSRAALADLARRAWSSGAREWERDRLAEAVFEDVDAGMTSGFATAPVWVIVCGDTDRALPSTIAESVYPAVQNLLLAATAQMLGSTLTTIINVFDDELRERFEIPPPVRPVAAIPIGYPSRSMGLSRRRPVEQHTHRETFARPWGSTSGVS